MWLRPRAMVYLRVSFRIRNHQLRVGYLGRGPSNPTAYH